MLGNDYSIDLLPDEDHAGNLIVDDQRHQLKVEIGKGNIPSNDYANLFFTSREALFDFALSLLRDAIYGNVITKRTANPDGTWQIQSETIGCRREILSYPDANGNIEVYDGVRLARDSARLNIYADDKLKD